MVDTWLDDGGSVLETPAPLTDALRAAGQGNLVYASAGAPLAAEVGGRPEVIYIVTHEADYDDSKVLKAFVDRKKAKQYADAYSLVNDARTAVQQTTLTY